MREKERERERERERVTESQDQSLVGAKFIKPLPPIEGFSIRSHRGSDGPIQRTHPGTHPSIQPRQWAVHFVCVQYTPVLYIIGSKCV